MSEAPTEDHLAPSWGELFPADEVVLEELEEERNEAPVKELIPLIVIGDWVRLAAASGVPKALVGRLATVTAAPLYTAPGFDELSDRPYQYQKLTDSYDVRVRETGDVLTRLTRAAFASFGPTEAQVERHS